MSITTVPTHAVPTHAVPTHAVPTHAVPAPDVRTTATSWRPLSRALWVGRSATGPVGTIERGRRFVATDAEGRRRGAYRSLEAAMTAFDPSDRAEEPPEVRSWEALALVATLAGAAGSLLATYALIGI